jgi:CheY-like chemotaxis protein
LAHRESELAEAKAAAEELTRRRERYLAFMSHELKSPISALSSAAEGLADDAAAAVSFMGMARKSLGRLLELIDGILDQARSKAGLLTLRKEAFRPMREASDLLEPFAIQARRKGLRFSLEMEPSLETLLLGDAVRFRQILANLTGNAIKYTPTGFVAIRLSGKPGERGFELKGEVEDSGIGIDPSRRDLIWEPFAGSEGGYANGLSSHGLGLSIVRSVVDAMGGTVEAASEPGRGSVFSFSLLFETAPGESEPSRPQAAAAVPDLRSLRALVADDDRLSRMVMARHLKDWGATVDEAATGSEAADLFSRQPYDLVVLDEHMPESSGTAAAAAIRTAPGGNAAFIVLSSADSTARAVGDGSIAEPGIDSVVPKPISAESMAAALIGRYNRS